MIKKIKLGLSSIIKSPFIKSALVLSVAGVLCKIIGVFYRVPLTNILGVEGMGIYGLVYPIYSLLLVLSSTALPVALSKIIAEKKASGQYLYIKKLIKVAYITMLILGTALSVILVVFSAKIALIQGTTLAKYGFIAISPSILFVALICVYRGVFQGFANVKSTANSQLIEQVVKVIFGLLFAFLLKPYGIEFAVCGAVISVTLSEFISLIYLKIKYNNFVKATKTQFYDGLNAGGETEVKTFDVFINLVKVNFVFAFGGIVVPAFLVVDSLIVVNLLVRFGAFTTRAVADFGIYSGVVNTLNNVPIVILSSIAISVLPLFAKEHTKEDEGNQNDLITKCLNLSFVVAIPCMLLFSVFSSQIIQILYPSLDVDEVLLSSKLLALSSSTILSLGLYYVLTTLLQAVNKYYFPILAILLFSMLRTLLYILLMQNFGIISLAIASSISYSLLCLVIIVYFKKCFKNIQTNVINIAFNSCLFVFVNLLLFYILNAIFETPYMFIFSTLLSGLFYVFLNARYIK